MARKVLSIPLPSRILRSNTQNSTQGTCTMSRYVTLQLWFNTGRLCHMRLSSSASAKSILWVISAPPQSSSGHDNKTAQTNFWIPVDPCHHVKDITWSITHLNRVTVRHFIQSDPLLVQCWSYLSAKDSLTFNDFMSQANHNVYTPHKCCNVLKAAVNPPAPYKPHLNNIH